MIDQESLERAQKTESFQEVHEMLSGMRGQFSGLEYVAGAWILAAERVEAWKKAGKASLIQYVADVLGCEYRTALDRVRVAHRLAVLPKIAEAARSGKLSFSVVRELTRGDKVTPETEAVWAAWAVDKRVHDVEREIQPRDEGDLPTDPIDPRKIEKAMRFNLTSDAWARVRIALDREKKDSGDVSMTDEEALLAMCDRAAPMNEDRAPTQVFLDLCPSCRTATMQTSAGPMAVDETVVEQACCDAQEVHPAHVGAKAKQTVAPATRREAFRKAGGRCQVPHCRGRAYECHHIKLRSEGGTHDLENLVVVCWAHHRRLHEGFLTVGRDPTGDVWFRHADGSEYGAGFSPSSIDRCADLFQTLRRMGFTEEEARDVVRDAGVWFIVPDAARQAAAQKAEREMAT